MPMLELEGSMRVWIQSGANWQLGSRSILTPTGIVPLKSTTKSAHNPTIAGGCRMHLREVTVPGQDRCRVYTLGAMIHLGRVKDYITHTSPLSLGDSSCRTEKPLRVRVEPGEQKRMKEHEQNNSLEGQSNKQKPPFTLSPFSPQSFNVNSPPVPRAHMHLTNWQPYVAGE